MNTPQSNSSEEVEEVDLTDNLLYYEFCLLAAAMTVVCVLAIAGNLLVMLSFILDKKLRTLNNYFLLSLAVSDIMMATFAMPLYTVYLLIGEWPFGEILCDMWLAQDYMCSTASGFNLLMISFDRYFSVTSPLRYRARRTGKHVAAMISCVWVLSFLIWTPWIYSWQYIEGKRTVPHDECYVQFVETNYYLTVVTSFIAYYMPVSILCILYYRIWRETVKRKNYLVSMEADHETKTSLRETSSDCCDVRLKKSSKTFFCCSPIHWTSKTRYVHTTIDNIELPIRTSPPPQTHDKTIILEKLNECNADLHQNFADQQNAITNDQAPLNSGFLNDKRKGDERVPLRMSSTNKSSGRNDNKAAKVVTAIVLAFIITATPYNVVVIVKSFNQSLVSAAVWHFCYFLFYVNSALDPVCYALANENFRKTYWSILKCSWSRKSTIKSSVCSNTSETRNNFQKQDF